MTIALCIIATWVVVAILAYLFLGPWIMTWKSVSMHGEMVAIVMMWPFMIFLVPVGWVVGSFFSYMGRAYDRLEERRKKKQSKEEERKLDEEAKKAAKEEREREEAIALRREWENRRQPPFRRGMRRTFEMRND